MTDTNEGVASGGVLLVGSVPLRSAEEVFQVMAAELGDRVRHLPDGETGPRSDWIVWQYPVLSSRPEFEVCPPGADVAPEAAAPADPRRRIAGHAAVRRPRLRPGRAVIVRRLRPPQAGRPDPGTLPVPGFAADAAGADRRLHRTGGSGPDRAALRGPHPPRADDDLRGDPARPAGDPVGHQLRVRHARRGDADLVRRSAVEHRRTPRPARAQHPGGRAARLSLLPRARAPPPRAPVRRAGARRHRQRAVAQPRPITRLDPPAGAGRARRRRLLRDPRPARPAPRDGSVPRAAPSCRRSGRRQGPPRRRPTFRPRLRCRHRLWLEPSSPAGGRVADRAPPGDVDGDRARRPSPRRLRLAGRVGADPRPRTGPPTPSTRSVRRTTTSPSTAGTATSTRPWTSSPTSSPTARS